MAINIEWQRLPIQDDNTADNTPLYPRIAGNETVDFPSLCEKVAKHSSLTKGTIINAMTDMADIIAKLLREGKAIDVDGLGTFRLSIGTETNVTLSTPLRRRRVTVRGVKFQPHRTFMDAIGTPEFHSMRHNTSPVEISNDQLQHILTEYFKTHDHITRSQFESLCHLRRTTAYTRLKEFVESGFLKKVGTNRDTRYECS